MNTTQNTCPACSRLSPVGIKCNHHRTESSVTRILRLAAEAGQSTTGTTRADQALSAENALHLQHVTLNTTKESNR